ncbi:hypothetical protein HPB47_005206, partial [Ixodes persulcatus]
TAPARGSGRLLGELARLSAPVRATCAPVRRRRASGSRPTDAFPPSRGDARGEDRGPSLTRLQVSSRRPAWLEPASVDAMKQKSKASSRAKLIILHRKRRCLPT